LVLDFIGNQRRESFCQRFTALRRHDSRSSENWPGSRDCRNCYFRLDKEPEVILENLKRS
jgi:hypothetical protein